ncbi:hypothetical protein [Phaffia rhodozyma]|uniref:Uncharacterized protein n=1 Tax=Phaffia rhodozyma TaxID=264483 RepID=A0A0F7SLE4_PHARH|nr:hypothetical protein [Phaffia rhodozyma]
MIEPLLLSSIFPYYRVSVFILFFLSWPPSLSFDLFPICFMPLPIFLIHWWNYVPMSSTHRRCNPSQSSRPHLHWIFFFYHNPEREIPYCAGLLDDPYLLYSHNFPFSMRSYEPISLRLRQGKHKTHSEHRL